MKRLVLSTLFCRAGGRVFVPSRARRAVWRLVLPLALCFALAVCPAFASSPGRFILSEFSLQFKDGQLLLGLGVDVADREALRILLKDGAQMELSGTVKIVQPRSLLPNIAVAERPISFYLRHDTLTREFELRVLSLAEIRSLQRPTDGSAPPAPPPAPSKELILRDKELDRLLNSTLKSLVIPVTPVSVFTEGVEYRLELSLSLRHTDVPPWLSRSLLFWSWDVVPSASYEVLFHYEGSGGSTP